MLIYFSRSVRSEQYYKLHYCGENNITQKSFFLLETELLEEQEFRLVEELLLLTVILRCHPFSGEVTANSPKEVNGTLHFAIFIILFNSCTCGLSQPILYYYISKNIHV